MKCKQCETAEVTGKSQYCSESCKTVYNRNKRQAEQAGTVVQPATGTELEELVLSCLSCHLSLDRCIACSWTGVAVPGPVLTMRGGQSG